MNIEIRVITNAKKKEIKREDSGWKVKLTSLPRGGKANEELIEYLASLFSVKKSEIKILRGKKDKQKLVFIPVDEETLNAFLKEKARVTTS
jgi:uncharacterized protein (TIGR00251 family)